MAEREAGSEGTPVGGSRRRSRPPEGEVPFEAHYGAGEASPADRDRWPASVQPILDKSSDDACPWLYLHAEPDARAAFVTAEHRCEIRPDEVPGPGHQLAYCLTTNHISCPQLRSYEARRRSEAEVVRATQAPPASLIPPADRGPSTALADFRPSQIGGSRTREQTGGSFMFSRLAWAAMGAFGALLVVVGLAVYGNPGDGPSPASGDLPASLPRASAPTPDAAGRLAGPLLTTTATPGLPPQVPSDVAAAGSSDRLPDDPAGEGAAVDIDAVVLGPVADDAEAEPTVDPKPQPTPQIYTVASGDTLAQIARDFGTSVAALIEANAIAGGAVISVGDELIIPASANDPE